MVFVFDDDIQDKSVFSYYEKTETERKIVVHIYLCKNRISSFDMKL